MSERTTPQPKEHYRALDVGENVSQEELARQFQRLRTLYQPDNISDADARRYASQKLAQIEEAYAILGDPARRAIYDGRPLAVAAHDPDTLFCANHPNTETLLRCNKCGKPICMKCAVQTPVGYRCTECVRQQQNVYFNALGSDNFIALGVGFLVSAIAAPLVGMLLSGFGFFGLIIAFIAGSGAGSLLAQIIRRAVGRRRGRRLPAFALIGIISGVLVGSLALLLFTGFFLLFDITTLLFTGLAIAAAYPQLR
ncbi:MAG: DnaJ domain-containing protein [Caldilineaceae bacterium]|nr:DnaJ domain-containing protein [Caldilineaceae bacterium]HRJ40861.1 DnaJ domain-containing protein [Caldilineaceae bacterium]